MFRPSLITTSAKTSENLVPVTSSHLDVTMEAAHDLAIASLATTPTEQNGDPGFFRKRSWQVNGCLLVESEANFSIVGRRTSRQFNPLDAYLVLHRFVRGHSLGHFDHTSIQRRPGSVYLMDVELPREGVRHGGLLQSIYLPKSRIGFDSARHTRFLELSAATYIGNRLQVEMETVFGYLKRVETLLPANAIDRLLAYVRLAFDPEAQHCDIRKHARDVLFDRICVYIETHLASPSIGVRTILDQFGVSRASLFRMFEAHGGVRSYIMDRRALKAVMDLSRTSQERGSVRAVSERYGFSTGANFNRAIQRAYGNSPGALFPVTQRVFSPLTMHVQPEPRVEDARSIGQDLSSKLKLSA
ncbi:MAG: helix-turn-helix domain-containing protein [Hyphomonadaceae bacterium]|nr:helix-turn-helix domain-containing protein [Hyphomonadaceae bacterium]